MKKVTYLIFLYILLFQAWSIRPFGNISGDFMLFIYLCYVFYGYKKYKKGRCIGKYLRPYKWIIIGIILSMIPAYLYYNQGVLQSVLTYRTNIYWLTIPLLVSVAPTEKDIIDSCLKITIIMYLVYLLRLLYPGLFVLDEKVIENMGLENGPTVLLGFSMPTIPIFYYLMRIREKYELKYVIIIFVCFLYLFIMQNRSTLFPIICIIGWSFLHLKSKYKFILLFFLSVIIGILFIKTYDVWSDLINETTDQINDPNYNRNKSLVYFLYMASKGPLTYILGNGFLSAHSTPLMQDMMDLGIYNSDLGFIGYWNQYGIIPIIIFIWTMVYPLIHKRRIPIYLSLWALQMLACSFTISYFGLGPHILYYSLYYYLFIYYKNNKELYGRDRNY